MRYKDKVIFVLAPPVCQASCDTVLIRSSLCSTAMSIFFKWPLFISFVFANIEIWNTNCWLRCWFFFFLTPVNIPQRKSTATWSKYDWSIIMAFSWVRVMILPCKSRTFICCCLCTGNETSMRLHRLLLFGCLSLGYETERYLGDGRGYGPRLDCWFLISRSPRLCYWLEMDWRCFLSKQGIVQWPWPIVMVIPGQLNITDLSIDS